MLNLAVNAHIPLIATRTRDTINVLHVLEFFLKGHKKPLDISKQDKVDKVGQVYYRIVPKRVDDKTDYTSIYGTMAKLQSTLIVINPTYVHDAMFDIGELPVPKELKKRFLTPLVLSEDEKDKAKIEKAAKKVEAMTGALGGCTIKESIELTLLTMARDASITPTGLVATRKQVFQGTQGLTQIDTQQDFYEPMLKLEKWAEGKRNAFFNAPDHRLRPRGLLFDGPPGTGKTEGAKFLASQWGVPLFRIDVSSTKNKYVGQSQENLQTAISRIDTEEPCIVLIDEVEKVFSSNQNDSSGTTSDMLSQMLWWLAEHKTRVLTVMTTNKRKSLPPELYREGRIDDVFMFGGMEFGAALKFAEGLSKTFKMKVDHSEIAKLAVDEAMKKAFETDPPTVSPALVSESVKEQLVKKL